MRICAECHTLLRVKELEHAIMDYIDPFMQTPWIFVLVFAIAFIDGFFPVVPGETTVIAAGAVAASTGYPNIALIIAVAALGAFGGDHVSYAIGRFAFGPIARRLKPGTKKKKAFDWAHDALEKRGGIVLIVARYIPGGRTAITITSGAVRYSLRKFSFFDSIAAVSWGVYSGMIGFLAGKTFEGRPLLALGLGFAIAIVCAGIMELVRFLLEKRAKAREALAVAVPAPRVEDAAAPVPVKD
ncbi:DedA family membrane protein [Stackebrandtia nassauensis DSM 44728]|uniref:DedA family membrane protein n=1 Tax=Stackebrandtia nassauensis (strain DSM 44728 / CIP 108903 / NRRL B-16338 / NBRC 102104 / LLR-40K-21) TaxID=446470 RepID=D3QC05_STANL|nr:DedA family membrane protein [Stackebrandtia nassauensis DSM 44728]